MKKLILLATLMVATASGINASSSSQATTKDSKSFFINRAGEKIYLPQDRIVTPNEIPGLVTPKKSPDRIATIGPSKTITVKLVYDKDVYIPECFSAGWLDYCDSCILGKGLNDAQEVEIPYGVDTALVVWYKYNEDNGLKDFYTVFKDLSDVLENGEVTFDVSECIHQVSYQYYNPEGKEMNLAIWNRDENGDRTSIAVEGDYDSLFHCFMWITPGASPWYGCGPTVYSQAENGDLYFIDWNNFYFNSCGPDFGLAHYVIAKPIDGYDYTCIQMPTFLCPSLEIAEITGPTKMVISNEPDNFNVYEQTFTRSDYSLNSYDALSFGSRLIIESDNATCVSIGVEDVVPYTDKDVTIRQTICHYEPEMWRADVYGMLNVDICPEDDSDMIVGISSMAYKATEDGRVYKPINLVGQQGIGMPYETALNFYEGNYTDWMMIKGAPNPYLNFSDSQQKGKLWNCCPLISLVPNSYENYEIGSDLLQWHYGLVGRYGEGNYLVNLFLTEYEETQEYDAVGYRTFNIWYDGALVDGEIEGRAEATAYIKKGEYTDDFTPPVITHLWFKDNEENITDRFDRSDEGMIEIYAADFRQDWDWSLGEYFCQYLINDNTSAQIEYAPYGTENWNLLEAKENKERYFFPGYGHCFQASLGDVSTKSSNGWFDVRVSLADEAGNKMVQTLSPAFYVNSNSGVTSPEAYDSSDDSPVYYDLAGRRVAATERGIYIEKRGSETRKIFVK